MISHSFTAIVVSCLIFVYSAGSQETPPAFNLTQQQRDDLAAPVIQALRNLQQQGGTALLDYLQNINLGNLDQPEPDESVDAVVGKSLSKLFFGDLRPFDQDRLLDGKNLVRTNDEYKTSISIYTMIDQLAKDESQALFEWLVSRSTKSPVTRCDKVVLASLPTDFNGFGDTFWTGTQNSWKALLTAKNPVYRLIAMRNLRFFEANADTLLFNYKTGLTERNTLLQHAAFEGLKLIGTPAAKAALQTFLNQHLPANDGSMPDGFDINATIREYLSPP